MKILAGALLAMAANAAVANSLTTDYSDLWWNPNESGWGANIAQQTDTMVVTFFVYAAHNDPTWFISPDATLQSDGTYKGTLYSTTGPYYRNPFHASAVTATAIGTFTFIPASWASGTIIYTIGGDKITKDVTRETWRSDDLSGYYFGARMGYWTGCGPPLDGKVSSPTQFAVTHMGTDFSARDQGNGYTCTYSGTVNPQGRGSSIAGFGVCDDQVNREFTATEVFVSREGFTMRYRLHQTGTTCNFDGYVGGIRRIQ